MVTLGNLLANIADTDGTTRRLHSAEFLRRVEGHPEKKLLMECHAAACRGEKKIRFKKNVLPPESLEKEGFYLVGDDPGNLYCFE